MSEFGLLSNSLKMSQNITLHLNNLQLKYYFA